MTPNRWVAEPLVPPHTCAIIAGRGKASEPRGFYDTGNELPGIDPHIYLSVAGIEHVAKELGWIPPEVLTEAHEEIAQLRAKVEQLEEENQHVSVVLDAIDTLESADFRARKRAGRKPKPKVERPEPEVIASGN